MECPAITNLGMSPHIKTGESNPVGGKGSQNQEKKSEKNPILLLVVPREPQTAQP